MANGDIKQITLPQSSGGGTYNIVDQGARDLITALEGAMVFKGTLGTGGTISTLPVASASNKGFTYKVITDGSSRGISYKAGDTVISDGSAWVLIPSGDEPSGTVTNIATGTGLTGGPIMTTGTISIDTTVVATKSDLNNKQDKLPTGNNDTYLHKNATTGNLEWTEVQGGGTSLTTDDYLTSAEMEEIIGSEIIWDGSVD